MASLLPFSPVEPVPVLQFCPVDPQDLFQVGKGLKEDTNYQYRPETYYPKFSNKYQRYFNGKTKDIITMGISDNTNLSFFGTSQDSTTGGSKYTR